MAQGEMPQVAAATPVQGELRPENLTLENPELETVPSILHASCRSLLNLVPKGSRH